MLIDLKYLKDKYNLNLKGVCHIGASHAEEFDKYVECGIKNQIWIEAIPDVYKKMCDILIKKDARDIQCSALNLCISDVSGKEVDFHITDNEGQSSSMLELDYHKIVHPNVKEIKSIKLITKTLMDVARSVFPYFLFGKDINFLNLDIQGAELLAFKGAGDLLNALIDYIYCEVNTKELYKGCALLEEIDDYLYDFGFKRVEIKMTDCFWGDAFYIKS